MPSQREAETRLGISLPYRLVMALHDPSDPIRKRVDLLTLDDGPGGIVEANEFLRPLEWRQWPDYIIAFASGGCGDYFAFDTRTVPYRVYYIDTLGTVAESIASCEQEAFVFESFDHWYVHEISQAA